jgi:hypothetical protein
MYQMLSNEDKGIYTLSEWRYAIGLIAPEASTYTLYEGSVRDDGMYYLLVEVNTPSGEVVPQEHIFAYEDNTWKHWLNNEEMNLIDGVL